MDSECNLRGAIATLWRCSGRICKKFWSSIGVDWAQKKEYTLIGEKAIVQAEFQAFEGPIYRVISEDF